MPRHQRNREKQNEKACCSALSMLILFSGCSRLEEADKAAWAIVDCYISERCAELELIYRLADRLIQKENQNVFLTTMQNALPEVSEEKIASLHQKLSTHLKKATSYSVHVKRDTGKEAVVAIRINWIASWTRKRINRLLRLLKLKVQIKKWEK
ncbi:hypothetical protein [Listeria valentina]|uniref:hypothetical protein n=1 Tax=Listeria valentina TaxID=2705293 RepID=UPI001431BAF3|nr:hypothetical protein [Listeria valentina]